MLSSTMALFTRAFRVDARSARPHVLRFVFVVVILLQLIAVHEMDLIFGAPGRTMFTTISWLNFAVITFAGIGYFATAISEEKEEDSLGLLKMAGISPAALLLGKSTTRMITVLLLLAVEFPFILLSITLGGVTMTQVIAMSIALAAYLVFVANLGLILSVVGTNARQASTLTTLSLVLLLIVLPIAGEIAGAAPLLLTSPYGALLKTFATWQNKLSMWSRINIIASTGFAESPVSAQVVCHLLAALGFFGLSWVGFERFTRERHTVGTTERILARPAGTVGPAAGPRASRPINRAWSRALMWKDFYFVNGGMLMLRVRFVLYFLLIGGLSTLFVWSAPWQFSWRQVGGTAMMTMIVAFMIELGLVASRVFRDEVQAHTLPLLVMLPQSTAHLAWSKAASAVPTVIPSVVFFLLGALLDIEDFGGGLQHVVFTWLGVAVIVWFVFFLHLAAYLSLVVKWGALPLAIFLVGLYHAFVTPLFAMLNLLFFRAQLGGGLPTALSQIAIGVAGIILLEFRIPRRLRHLAGQ